MLSTTTCAGYLALSCWLLSMMFALWMERKHLIQSTLSPESHLSHESYETYKPFIETRPPEVVANIIICLIHQTNYLLDRQLKQLEAFFLKEGGLRERMTRA